MSRVSRSMPASRLALLTAALATLCACAVAPTTPSAGTALVVEQQATLEGDVLAIDTAPWAYDGNAVVTVSTSTAGTVAVQLPARWNLCRAQPLDDLQALKPHDRVRVVGTVTAAATLVVCEQPQHLLRRVE